ncbi:hypothetical protein, partial [Pseudomonas migulae]
THKKAANIAAFSLSACSFFQRPAQHIQCITAVVDRMYFPVRRVALELIASKLAPTEDRTAR